MFFYTKTFTIIDINIKLPNFTHKSMSRMDKKPFQEYHLLKMLDGYRANQGPLDWWIADYFRGNKALGSKDKAFVSDTAYALVRWKGLFEYLARRDADWEQLFETYRSTNISEKLLNETIPLNIRYSFPKWLFDKLVSCYGQERACELCLQSNERAPTTVRANAAKCSRDELLQKWSVEYDVSPCLHAPNGITFNKKINLFGLTEFKEGLFEVQDEGSQLLADLLDVKPGHQVLDYCAGAGGKALAIAPAMQHKGQLFLFDIRTRALQEAKKRLRRAGVTNIQIVTPDSPNLKKMKKKMDRVLVDAPCSGTGTLRRNPEMKWRSDEETIERLIGQQRIIFEKALSFLKNDGIIVYCTCSLLKEENQNQVDHFIKTYNLELVQPLFQSFPAPGGMDGFFGAVLKKI